MPRKKNNTKDVPDVSKIRGFFEEVQELSGRESQQPVFIGLKKLYLAVKEHGHPHTKTFLRDWTRYCCIVCQASESIPAVDNVMEFVARFSVRGDTVLDEEGCASSPLAEGLLKYFVKQGLLHSATRSVRLQAIRMTDRILKEVSEAGQSVDLELCEELTKALVSRTNDRLLVVRCAAIDAVTPFQDRKDPNCPVVNALEFLAAKDSRPEVRIRALHNLSLCRRTLPSFVERTRDEDEKVREEAVRQIVKRISIRNLHIHMRMQILKRGLKDHSEKVVAAYRDELIPTWLAQGREKDDEGDKDLTVAFLKGLDLINESETARLALFAVFSYKHPVELVTEFCSTYLKNGLMEPERLSPEMAFYWRQLVEFVRETCRGAEQHDLLDALLPTLKHLSEYVAQYIDEHPPASCESQEAEFDEEFVSLQLIALLPFAESSDLAGKNTLRKVLEDLIQDPKTNINLVEGLMKLYVDWYEGNVAEAVRWTADAAGLLLQTDPIQSPAHDLSGDENATLFPGLKTDPATLTKCLTMVGSLVKFAKITKLYDQLRTVLIQLIVPSVYNENPVVRNLAFRALGCCCTLNRELSSQYFSLFIKTLDIDVDVVQLSALEAVFDLLLIHGMDLLVLGEESVQEATERAINHFLKVLEQSQESELRCGTVLGVCKLLINRRLYSPKALARLIISWFNPANHQDNKLRNCIWTFLRVFAYSARRNQEQLVAGIPETLRILLEAPVISPLAKVDRDQVVKCLANLTNGTQLLDSAPGKEEGSVHGSLGLSLCELLGNAEEVIEMRLYSRLLAELELRRRGIPLSVLADLRTQLEDLLTTIEDSSTKKKLETTRNNTIEALAMEGDEEAKRILAKIPPATPRRLRNLSMTSTAEEDEEEESTEQSRLPALPETPQNPRSGF